jgi:3-methyladenine DNA glycosylase/8-oxoguanine DNA glycosylase
MKVSQGRKIPYDTIGNFCREYFGPYAGYAQQFLYATRDNEKIK